MKGKRKPVRRTRTKAELKARTKAAQENRDDVVDPDILVASFFKALDKEHNAWGFDLNEEGIHFAGALVPAHKVPQVIDWMADNLFDGGFSGAPMLHIDFPDIGKVAFVVAQGASSPRDIARKLRKYDGRYVVFKHSDPNRPRVLH